MRILLPTILIFSAITSRSQTLVDSIPYPGMLNLNFWGIHVTADTIFLGADGPGPVHFSDHQGSILGSQATGYTYNHGLIKRDDHYLIAKDYTSQGSILHMVGLDGQLIGSYNFPAGVLGTSQGIGDLEEAGGGAIWFTVYEPDAETYPFSYAYKWVPGTTALLDTVPLNGKQPYGVALKGDTLLYVIDNIHGDQERIYAYDLTNEQDLFWFELPDTPIDNDQRPFGMHWDGNYLYLVANRQGGSAFAHQTIFIYSIDGTVGIAPVELNEDLQVFPNPASDRINVNVSDVHASGSIRLIDPKGAVIKEQRLQAENTQVSVETMTAGNYWIQLLDEGRVIARKKVTVVR